MKRCPKCGETYDAAAAWCPTDGTQLISDDNVADDLDAGHTLRDLQSPLGPGLVTMGWDIPDVSAMFEAMKAPADEPAPTPPRTTPTELAAVALPSTMPGVRMDRLKASTLPPAAPRMTPRSLASALARAPAPVRPAPIHTPTSISVPVPLEPVPGPAEPPLDRTLVAPPFEDTLDVHTLEAETLDTHPIEIQVIETPGLEPPPPIEVPIGLDATLAASPLDAPPPLGPPPSLRMAAVSALEEPPQPPRKLTMPMGVVLGVEQPPVIAIVPVHPTSNEIAVPPQPEFTAPVPQVSVELKAVEMRAPITMPGVIAPPIHAQPRPRSEQPLPPRKPPSPSDAPPMSAPPAVAAPLAQPSGSFSPPVSRSLRWLWIALAVILVAAGATAAVVATR